MLSNELVMPALLRWHPLGIARGKDLSGLIKTVRRISIVLLLAFAYLYTRVIADRTLTSIGLLSFAAVLQFAPETTIGELPAKKLSLTIDNGKVMAGIVPLFAIPPDSLHRLF